MKWTVGARDKISNLVDYQFFKNVGSPFMPLILASKRLYKIV